MRVVDMGGKDEREQRWERDDNCEGEGHRWKIGNGEKEARQRGGKVRSLFCFFWMSFTGFAICHNYA